MQVQDIMTPGVEFVRPDDTVAKAAAKMADLDVGVVPVIGDAEEKGAVGILTDRDIVVRTVATGSDPATTRVGDIMSTPVTQVSQITTVNQLLRIMEQKQIRRVVVDDENGRMVGMVSLGDVATSCGKDEDAGQALEKISEPAEPER